MTLSYNQSAPLTWVLTRPGEHLHFPSVLRGTAWREMVRLREGFLDTEHQRQKLDTFWEDITGQIAMKSVSRKGNIL